MGNIWNVYKGQHVSGTANFAKQLKGRQTRLSSKISKNVIKQDQQKALSEQLFC